VAASHDMQRAGPRVFSGDINRSHFFVSLYQAIGKAPGDFTIS